MNFRERIGLGILLNIDPEKAHKLSLMALKMGLTPQGDPFTSPRLRIEVAGLSLPNPVGLAAGYDKNAEAIKPLLSSGFGFVEVGAATPKPQPGNPKPRLFRLTEDSAVINRFGFNNEGARAIVARLQARPDHGLVGLNLGANKASADKAADFAEVLKTCGDFVDFVTVNVSSPNTEKLRELQGADALRALLDNVIETREQLRTSPRIFLKIAPDLNDREIAEIAQIAVSANIDAIIATNTTLTRDDLQSHNRDHAGGLSGEPLFERSTRVLALLAQQTDAKLPLIGVGGISSSQQAYTKIKAGASAVQLYTAMVYHGISLVGEIAQGLDQLLAADGYSNVADAVGVERDLYS
ncbi:MAG: dihydroorotate dehydrogenase [Paracoccaceae bacterium]|jgi:dihydroorotate dehydrogenase